MFIDSFSNPLAKALLNGNSQNVQWSDIAPSGDEPVGAGIFAAGIGGNVAPQQLLIVPYSGGAAYGQYGMRLWALHRHGDINDTNNVLWLPLLLAEFLCTAGTLTGLQSRLIKENEFFASRIVLVNGNLGMYGFVSSPQADEALSAPWSATAAPVPIGVASTQNQIAYLKIGLSGAQKFRFDFSQGDVPLSFGNALWANASAF